MNHSFEKFIEVRLRHDYYLDGMCRDLRAIPTPSTLALLAARRFRVIPRPDGFSLAGPVAVDGAGNQQARFPLEAGERLVFALVLASPDFVYFTDLPLQASEGRRYLLRNREGMSRLSLDASVGAGDQVRLVGRYFTATVTPSASGSPVVVEDEAGRLLAVSEVPSSDGDALEISFALGERDGPARIRGGGRPVPEPIFVNGDLLGMNAFALLQLEAPSEGWPAYPTAQGRRTIAPATFHADFRRRETRWRYHVVTPRGAFEPGALSIGYPAQAPPPYPRGITFARITFPEVAGLFQNKDVASFESNLALPLHEGPLRNVRLETPQRTIVPQLRNAPRNVLKQTGTAGAQHVSEIFVSL